MLDFPSELQCLAPVLLNNFVSVAGEPQLNIAVPVEHVCMKCFNILTVGISGLTQLINLNEVAK